ncbi:MAG: hypothetical protein E7514_06050 [Ruminococcaceae bacterium]|nr:hypothetical protein [Oscillospiraceae bacterium]
MADFIKNKEYFLNLVSGVICGTELSPLPSDADAGLIYKLACKSNMQTVIYFADEHTHFAPAEINGKLKKSYQTSAVRETNQQMTVGDIRRDFTQKSIPFIFLKGTHLKTLYPIPEMRFMVDMDVLVKKEDVARASEILESYGFECEMNNGKDIVFVKKPFLTVELHNTLFDEGNPMSPYFLGVWDRALKADGAEYVMSESDLYIYTLAHLCEHYTNAEACFRPLTDIYLMNKKLSDRLDFDYINEELGKLDLTEFAENIRKLGYCIYEGAEKDKTLLMMENFIILGPPMKNASEANKADRSKSGRILTSLFPSLRHMKKHYTILEKMPFLLPFMWLARIFTRLFKKGSADKLKAINETGKKDYETLKEIYRRSGIKK